jgi:hypothetical protein
MKWTAFECFGLRVPKNLFGKTTLAADGEMLKRTL